MVLLIHGTSIQTYLLLSYFRWRFGGFRMVEAHRVLRRSPASVLPTLIRDGKLCSVRARGNKTNCCTRHRNSKRQLFRPKAWQVWKEDMLFLPGDQDGTGFMRRQQRPGALLQRD